MKTQSCPLSFDSQIQILEPVDDEIITTRIQTALEQDDAMKNTFIHVQTFAGGVELTGWVDKYMQKQQALTLAVDVQGVSYVVNNLIVRD